MSYQGNRPNPNNLPSCSPPLLPAPASCGLSYVEKSGYAACGCRRFAILFCDSREVARGIWKERHMGIEGNPGL